MWRKNEKKEGKNLKRFNEKKEGKNLTRCNVCMDNI